MHNGQLDDRSGISHELLASVKDRGMLECWRTIKGHQEVELLIGMRCKGQGLQSRLIHLLNTGEVLRFVV